MNGSCNVAIARTAGGYPSEFPFHPHERYPEYRGEIAASENAVYDALRRSFVLLGYDRERFGTPDWNPLGHLIRPGDRVFIKPNLCTHEYGRKQERLTGDLFAVITHPSVIRAIADYVAIALKGRGEIIIGDNPTIDTDFSVLLEKTGLNRLSTLYRDTFGLTVSVRDLRELWCDDIQKYGDRSLMTRLAGDPLGETVVNLGEKSFLYRMNPLLFRGVFTDRWDTIRHHHGSTQEYAVANSIYQSDVYISAPKLKTHHKVGATLNIKGLVGMCTKKNYLVHWRIGFPSWGGDEYPAPERASDHVRLFLKHLATAALPQKVAARVGKRIFRRPYCGAWQGNDTCWRMAADLYMALMTRPRKHFSVIDGVLAGQHNGPFCVMSKHAETLISGENLLFTDCAAVRMMDFRLDAVRYLGELLRKQHANLSEIRLLSDDYDVDGFFADPSPRYLKFIPPSNWPGLALNSTSDVPGPANHSEVFSHRGSA